MAIRRLEIAIKKTMTRIAFFCLLLCLPVAYAQAAPASVQPKWIFPAVPGFGGVHPRPDLPVRPDPKVDYKIFVDVASSETNKQGHYGALNRLARLVNLMAYAGVPPSRVHIVALLDGRTMTAALRDPVYKRHFKTTNPNLAILHALKKAGVTLMVCSQALAGFGVPDSAIDPAVTVTLSALTDTVVYGQKGYIYMRL